MRKILAVLPIALSVLLSYGRIYAQNAGQAQLATSDSTTLHRNYPGGRDDSDLTVQPHKRITKKESDRDDSFEEDGAEFDGSADPEDFGE